MDWQNHRCRIRPIDGVCSLGETDRFPNRQFPCDDRDRTRPLFKLAPDPSLLQTFRPSPHVLRRQASPLGRAYPNSRSKSQRFTIFLALRVHPCRHGLLPGPRGSSRPPPSSEKVCPSLESLRTRFLNCPASPRIDFVQDLYLKELKVYKPAPKVPRPVSSPVPNLSTHSRSRTPS